LERTPVRVVVIPDDLTLGLRVLEEQRGVAAGWQRL